MTPAEFLQAVQPGGPWLVTAIAPGAAPCGTLARTPGDVDALTAIHAGADLYFNPALLTGAPVNGKATKSDVAGSRWHWVDLDPPKGADLDAWRSDALARLRAANPSIIIDSGRGFWGFWQRATFSTDHAEIEGINKALGEPLGADACHNVDRLARLPGTTNSKTGRTASVVAWTTGPATLPASVAKDAPTGDADWTTGPVPEANPITDDGALIAKARASRSAAAVFGDGVSFEDLWTANVDRLAERWHARKAGDPFDRSEADASLAARLLWWTGRDCERTARLMRQSALAREKWNRPDYLRRTVLTEMRRPGGSFYCAGSAEPVSGETNPYEEFWAYLPGHSYIYRPTRQPWPAAAVDGALPWPESKDGKKFRPSAWLDKNRPVHQLTWHPSYAEVIEGRLVIEGGWAEHPGARTYNLYRAPGMIAGTSSEARPWIDHLNTIYPDNADHIASWLAHRIQRPGDKINHALVLGGTQGIGKDSLLEPIKHGVGPWNFREIGPQQLLGRFNPWVRAVVLRISESYDLGDLNRFAFYEHCKTYLACPPDTLLCDEKNTREHPVFNVMGVIITTNHKTSGLYLSPDDRRHFVAWSDAGREMFSPEYWTNFWAWLNGGGAAHVVAYLQALDLSRFDPKAPPPKTEAWHAIVSAGIAPEDAELGDLIAAMGSPAVLTFSDLQSAAFKNEMPSIVTDLNDPRRRKAMVHRLDRANYRQVRNPDEKTGRWFIGGKKINVYGRNDMTTRDQIAAVRAMA